MNEKTYIFPNATTAQAAERYLENIGWGVKIECREIRTDAPNDVMLAVYQMLAVRFGDCYSVASLGKLAGELGRFQNIHIRTDVCSGIDLIRETFDLSRGFVYGLALPEIRELLMEILAFDLNDLERRNAQIAVFWIDEELSTASTAMK